jgi:hypothetical protein
MTDFDALEKAGHDLTMLAPMLAGITTYYCERCGAVVTIGKGVMRVFHLPPGSPSKTSQCVELPLTPGNGRPRTLKSKLADEDDFKFDPELAKLRLDPEIAKLIRWRSDLTDRYGDDLLCLISGELGSGTEIDPRLPPELKPVLERFRAMPYAEREKQIEAALPDDVETARRERERG